MKQISVLLMVLFLSGCGFSGIMPGKYDGETLEVDTEAAALYEDENKLLNEGLSDRYHFTNTTLERTAENPGEAVTIGPGSYEIGEDIGEGRYEIGEGDTSAGALVTYDAEGVRVNEITLGFSAGQLVLDLTDGMTLEYKVRDGEIGLVPDAGMPSADMGGEASTIPAGIHEIGKHLAAGEYALITNEMPVQRADGTKDIYVNYMSTYSVIVNDPQLEGEIDTGELLVTLNEGDMIITEYPITIRKE